ncbi:hypothetical protein [Trabulsiella odontotermitis]|nr:hypothetical protein [Trabulsiella odontotermitis]
MVIIKLADRYQVRAGWRYAYPAYKAGDAFVGPASEVPPGKTI